MKQIIPLMPLNKRTTKNEIQRVKPPISSIQITIKSNEGSMVFNREVGLSNYLLLKGQPKNKKYGKG